MVWAQWEREEDKDQWTKGDEKMKAGNVMEILIQCNHLPAGQWITTQNLPSRWVNIIHLSEAGTSALPGATAGQTASAHRFRMSLIHTLANKQQRAAQVAAF